MAPLNMTPGWGSFRTAAIFFLTACCAGCAKAPESVRSAPSREHIVVTVPGETRLRPMGMAAAADGIIVVGSAPTARRAWASKVRPDGHVVWTYMPPWDPADAATYPPGPGASSSAPTIDDAVPLDDGTTVLCGETLRGHGSRQPSAFFARVGSDGRPLYEHYVLTGEINDLVPRYRVRRCAPWRGGIALIGLEQHGPTLAGTPRGASLLVAFADVDGAVLWRKQMPVAVERAESGPDTDSLTVVTSRERLFVSVSNNANWTQLQAFTERGDIAASVRLEGRYILAEPANRGEGAQVHALGGRQPVGQARELLVLDRDLQGTARAPLPALVSFVASGAYYTSDGAIFAFGSSFHRIGQRFRAAVLLCHPREPEGKLVEFTDPGLIDLGTAVAAAPFGPSWFATLRQYVPRSEAGNVPPGGVVIDFVEVR